MEIHQSQSGMVNPMVGPGGKGGNMQRGDDRVGGGRGGGGGHHLFLHPVSESKQPIKRKVLLLLHHLVLEVCLLP